MLYFARKHDDAMIMYFVQNVSLVFTGTQRGATITKGAGENHGDRSLSKRMTSLVNFSLSFSLLKGDTSARIKANKKTRKRKIILVFACPYACTKLRFHAAMKALVLKIVSSLCSTCNNGSCAYAGIKPVFTLQ